MALADAEMNTKYHGNLVVPPEMARILAQPGFIGDANGADRLRRLFVKHSITYDFSFLSEFGRMCFFGCVGRVKKVRSTSLKRIPGYDTCYR